MDSDKNHETIRQLIIAKIARLKSLNRTEVGAESDYDTLTNRTSHW